MTASLYATNIFIIILALISCIIFIAGYRKGLIDSIKDMDSPQENKEDSSSKNYIWIILTSVISASIFIALLGISPTFITFAPLLSILSATIIGLLFFIEPKLD